MHFNLIRTEIAIRISQSYRQCLQVYTPNMSWGKSLGHIPGKYIYDRNTMTSLQRCLCYCCVKRLITQHAPKTLALACSESKTRPLWNRGVFYDKVLALSLCRNICANIKQCVKSSVTQNWGLLHWLLMDNIVVTSSMLRCVSKFIHVRKLHSRACHRHC